MIDEVHLLNDETRGATVEAVISRMKLMIAQLHNNAANMLRIIAVSATLANINDVCVHLAIVLFLTDISYIPTILHFTRLSFCQYQIP